MSVVAGTLSPVEFFDPENLARLMGLAPRCRSGTFGVSSGLRTFSPSIARPAHELDGHRVLSSRPTTPRQAESSAGGHVSVPARYDAFWVPGLDHDIDRDESLSVGLRWLADAERAHETPDVIVMYAKSMVHNAQLLGEAARRWEFVSPRSKSTWRGGPVLAVWPPDSKVLGLAETRALDFALCVVAGRYDICAWVRKAKATCLVEGFEEDTTGPRLPPRRS